MGAPQETERERPLRPVCTPEGQAGTRCSDPPGRGAGRGRASGLWPARMAVARAGGGALSLHKATERTGDGEAPGAGRRPRVHRAGTSQAPMPRPMGPRHGLARQLPRRARRGSRPARHTQAVTAKGHRVCGSKCRQTAEPTLGATGPGPGGPRSSPSPSLVPHLHGRPCRP